MERSAYPKQSVGMVERSVGKAISRCSVIASEAHVPSGAWGNQSPRVDGDCFIAMLLAMTTGGVTGWKARPTAICGLRFAVHRQGDCFITMLLAMTSLSPLQKPFLPRRAQRSTKFFQTIVYSNSRLSIEPFRNPLCTLCLLWFKTFFRRVILVTERKYISVLSCSHVLMLSLFSCSPCPRAP